MGVILESEARVIKEGNCEAPATIQNPLKKYTEVFEEPKGLPPTRTHDHAIN